MGAARSGKATPADADGRGDGSAPPTDVVFSPFYPISGPRAAEEVVDEIAVAIRSGIYRPGDRLPTIQELAAAMGVSKPTVGEAIRVLAREGVVRAYRGATGGTIVASSDVPVTLLRVPGSGQEISLEELLEARRVIEMELALLAGRRATDKDFATMQRAIDELVEAVEAGDWRSVVQADHLFHYAMARAARSGMLAFGQHQILVRLAELFDGYVQHDVSETLTTHRATLAAIQSRDPDHIREVMSQHIGVLEGHAAEEERLGRTGPVR
jgi:DNA-binding FadR family transcriptional regulator